MYTVNARHVEYAEFERFPDNEAISAKEKEITSFRNRINNNPTNVSQPQLVAMEKVLKILQQRQRFRVKPVKSTASVEVTLDDSILVPKNLTGVSMLQLPVNMNDATTGHKLQGMSKDELVVASWSFIPNWIYVVLSRVRTLSGLFFLKPLPLDCLEKNMVPRELQAFERRMKDLERQVLQQ